MRRLLMPVALGLFILPATGCDIFFGGDDDCTYEVSGEVSDPIPEQNQRNPFTGECEYVGGGGGGGGGGGCNDTYGGAAEPDRAYQDWATCNGVCDALGEEACLTTEGCRAGYVDSCAGAGCLPAAGNTFYGCWGVAPSGPVRGGDCTQLDAYECSRHDDCSAIHYPDNGSASGGGAEADPALIEAIGDFERCIPEPRVEPGCFEDWECGEGQRCNAQEVCLPAPNGCGGTGPTPNGDQAVPCDDRCYGACVPDDRDPGTCYGQALCESIGPDCPEGTIAGVKDGCWTGFCIPVDECEMPPTCADTPTENACVARSECAPIYEGVNCTCDPAGNCTCDDWLYKACEDQLRQ